MRSEAKGRVSMEEEVHAHEKCARDMSRRGHHRRWRPGGRPAAPHTCPPPRRCTHGCRRGSMNGTHMIRCPVKQQQSQIGGQCWQLPRHTRLATAGTRPTLWPPDPLPPTVASSCNTSSQGFQSSTAVAGRDQLRLALPSVLRRGRSSALMPGPRKLNWQQRGARAYRTPRLSCSLLPPPI